MFLLDWRLAVFALVLVPFFVLLTQARRRAAQAHRRPAPAVDVRDLQPRPGVAVGLGHPARQDHGPRARPGRPLPRRVLQPGRPRGALAHGRPLGHGQHPGDLRDHAGARVLVRRHGLRRRDDLHRDPGRLHHAADAAVLPARLAAAGPGRPADLAGAVRARLRVPRPAGRDHRALGRPHARSSRPSAARSPSTTSGSATPPRATGPSPAPRSRCRAAPRPRSWARPARARPRSATCSRGSTTPSAAG